MVDYTMLASRPFIDINAIGNALATRQHLQDQPMRQMQAATELERAKIQNRVLFMEEAQRAAAEKARQANVEELLNMGANGPHASAGAANIPPPQNALAGAHGAPTAAPTPPGWRPPMALPSVAGNALAVPPPADTRPGYGPGVQDAVARTPYSPEAEGRLTARMAMTNMVQTRLESKVKLAKEMSEIDPSLGEKFWNQDPMLLRLGPASITGDAKTKEVKVQGKVIGTMVKAPGGKWTFHDAKGAGAVSDIGKLMADRNALVAEKAASGMSKEDIAKDKDVAAFDAEIQKKSSPKEENSKDKYLEIMTRIKTNKPVSDEEKQFAWAYEHEKILGPTAYGEQRFRMVMEIPVSVYDVNTGSVGLRTRGEINEANKENLKKGIGDRYVAAELGTKLKSRDAIMNEIATSSEIARKALNNLKKDFSQGQLIKFADQLRVDDDGARLTSFLSSNFAKTLTDDEIEYITAMRNLRESSFSLRTVGGMGQGSDMLRSAIAEMIPGPRNPNKKMANSAMDKFDIQVDSLWGGIPGIGAERTTRRKEAADKLKRKGDGKVEPRKPGESVADYLRRTSK